MAAAPAVPIVRDDGEFAEGGGDPSADAVVGGVVGEVGGEAQPAVAREGGVEVAEDDRQGVRGGSPGLEGLREVEIADRQGEGGIAVDRDDASGGPREPDLDSQKAALV